METLLPLCMSLYLSSLYYSTTYNMEVVVVAAALLLLPLLLMVFFAFVIVPWYDEESSSSSSFSPSYYDEGDPYKPMEEEEDREEEDWDYDMRDRTYDDLFRENLCPQNLIVTVEDCAATRSKLIDIYNDWTIPIDGHLNLLPPATNNCVVYFYDTDNPNAVEAIKDALAFYDVNYVRFTKKDDYVIISSSNDMMYDAIGYETDEVHFLVRNNIRKPKTLFDMASYFFDMDKCVDVLLPKPSKLCSSTGHYRTIKSFMAHKDKIGHCCILH